MSDFVVGQRVEFRQWVEGTVVSVDPLRVRSDYTDNLTTNPVEIRPACDPPTSVGASPAASNEEAGSVGASDEVLRFLFARHEAQRRHVRPRCWGISSDALAYYGAGKEPEPGLDEYPADPADLGACERTYAMAPEGIKPRMRPVLEKYRAHVAARYPDAGGEWCNCQATEGSVHYPGPWHPKGDETCSRLVVGSSGQQEDNRG
ncbi:hypothetical protein ABZ215_24935 [Amycolatopsis sp. NPDC006131]|uniref:hypothetical protein n=1 Tax=Amycolatopsis sp. NPDC006131 TaxID=3156731 RepID=UPI0033A6D872